MYGCNRRRGWVSARMFVWSPVLWSVAIREVRCVMMIESWGRKRTSHCPICLQSLHGEACCEGRAQDAVGNDDVDAGRRAGQSLEGVDAGNRESDHQLLGLTRTKRNGRTQRSTGG